MGRTVSTEEDQVKSAYDGRSDIKVEKGTMIGRYEVIDRIAPESGQNIIFIVKDTKNNGQLCAMKIETRSEATGRAKYLELELWILITMKKKTEAGHFCKVFAKGSWDKYDFMTLTLCGKSIRNLLKNSPAHKFSLGCAMSVARACLKAIMSLHKVGFIHRDIQPSNFAIGKGGQKELRSIYMLDFYYIHRYRQMNGALKVAREKPTKFQGNWKYASRTAHEGTEMSRACDVESWFYVLLEMCTGGLPWNDITDRDEMYKKKKLLATDSDFQKKIFDELPRDLRKIYNGIKDLTYEMEPSYGEYIELLDDAMKHSHAKEFPYDWESAEWQKKL